MQTYTYRIFDTNPSESDGNPWPRSATTYGSAKAALEAAEGQIGCADLHADDGYAVGDNLYVMVNSSDGETSVHTVTIQKVRH